MHSAPAMLAAVIALLAPGGWSVADSTIGVLEDPPASGKDGALEPVVPEASSGPQPAAPDPAGPADRAAGPETEIDLLFADGRRMTGLLIKATADSIVVRLAGIEQEIAISSLRRYDVLPPFLDRYQSLKRQAGDDPSQIVQVARWLVERERYELAFSEVTRALELKPGHPEAGKLKDWLELQIVLRAKRATAVEPAGPSRPARPSPRTPHRDPPLLSPEQVALMKVYEVDLAAAPRVVIPRGAITRLLQRYAGHPLVPQTREGRDAMLDREPAELLDLMFRLQARDFYLDVQVLDHPPGVRKFREDVMRTWLVNSSGCATTACHGGADAGRLRLAIRRPNADQTVYTNLYILERFRLADGTPLINWDEPARSPLLQLGLPREDSEFPHPPVPLRTGPGVGAGLGDDPAEQSSPRPRREERDAWRPIFRTSQERLYTTAVEWLNAMFRPRPDYTLDYTPIAPFEPSAPEPTADDPGNDPPADPVRR